MLFWASISSLYWLIHMQPTLHSQKQLLCDVESAGASQVVYVSCLLQLDLWLDGPIGPVCIPWIALKVSMDKHDISTCLAEEIILLLSCIIWFHTRSERLKKTEI